GDFGESEMAHQVDKGIELIRAAGEFEHKALVCCVDDMGAECIGDAQRLDTLFTGADHFDQCHFTCDVWPFAREGGDAMHRHQAVELRLDLLDDHFGAGGYDVDARAVAVAFHRGDGKAVDVIATA